MAYDLFNAGLDGAEVSDPDCSPDPFIYPALGVFNPTSYLDTTTMQPCDVGINNSRCLVMSVNTISPATLTYGVACNQGALHKSLHGRLQGTVRAKANYHFPCHYGLCCLQSQAALTAGGGGKAYALVFDTVFAGRVVRLIEINDGISNSVGSALGSTYTLLAESADAAFSPDIPHGLILEWESDPVTLKGTRLQAWYQNDDNTFIQLADIVHTGAGAHIPATSGDVAGAGVFMSMATNAIITYFDVLTISTEG